MTAAVEIVYEAPTGPRRWIVGGAAFAAVVLWVTFRSLRGPGWFALAAGFCVAVFALPFFAGGRVVLATRRVSLESDPRVLRVVHRRGERCVDVASVAEASYGVRVLPDGMSVDVVDLRLRDGSTLAFSVASAVAAEGVCRALVAARDRAPADAQPL